MRKLYVAALLLTSLSVSCSPPGVGGYYIEVSSFVFEYYSINGITADLTIDSCIEIGTTHSDLQIRYGALSKAEESKQKYRDKCEKNGDIGYKARYFCGGSAEPQITRFQERDFTEIRITSDADFDADHLAGESLGDLFRFYSTSPKKFIDRGYKDRYDWDDHDSTLEPGFKNYFAGNYYYDYEGDPVTGLVSELTPDDLILLGGGESYKPMLAVLVPEKQPTLAKTHNFTIVLVDDRGREMKTTIKVEFQ